MPIFVLRNDNRQKGPKCSAVNVNGTKCKRYLRFTGPHCSLHTPRLDRVVIAPSNIEAAGKGLFAVDISTDKNVVVFKKGEIMMEYSGEIRGLDLLKDSNEELIYAMESKIGRFIDARKPYSGNARYINDCRCANRRRGECEGQNARFIVVDSGRVFVQATKHIMNGEEIYASYGSDYWSVRKPETTKTRNGR